MRGNLPVAIMSVEPLPVILKGGKVVIGGLDLSQYVTRADLTMSNEDTMRLTIELVKIELVGEMLVERLRT